jgi:radical SAM superfamily enzyme YgiQ (UPF0313 family)
MEIERNGAVMGKVVLFYPTIEDMWQYVWFPFPYLYLGPFLEKAGFEVKVIDARVDEKWRDSLEHEIIDAVAVGITGMTGPDLINAMEACRLVKDVKPDLPIIWGGHHARQLPEQILNEGVGDYVFTGPAEYGLPELILSIEKGIEPEGIEGLVFYRNGQIMGDRLSPVVDFGYDVFPAFHLIDIEKYRSPNNIVSYFSSRGCPFGCSFCTTGDFSHSYRTLDQFDKEMNYLVNEQGFKNVFFQDGTFFISKRRVLKISKKMDDLGSDVKWKAKARANSLLEYTPDELSSLYDSGLRSVFFGIESGSQRVLDDMRKKIIPEHALKSVKICADYGFEFYASFMYATPGETTEDLRKTINLIRKIKKINPEAIIQNSVYIPLPGTPMYDTCLSHGYQPPGTMDGWSKRDISSNFENRDDINWVEPLELKEYIHIYNSEFGNYKHVYEREKNGEYESPFLKKDV